MSPAKIIIVTIGQPSTNPRMVKEYTVLKKAGYSVTVLYAHWANWAAKTDEELFANEGIDRHDFILVGGSPEKEKGKYLLSRLFFETARFFTFRLPLPFFWKMAVNQPAFMLSQKARREKADLYIAHNLAALPVVVEAAAKAKAACGFDAEDYHIGQLDEMAGKEYELRRRIEDTYMPRCNYISAASPLIAKTYEQRLALKDILVVNNVFSIRHLQPAPMPYQPGQPLKLFWFSQTVGSDRGLETLIAAMGQVTDHKTVCTLLGSCSESEKRRLLDLAKSAKVDETRLSFIAPVTPDEIFTIAARHHIGLALETNRTLNRRIALTNKIFTYPLAGIAIVATDTPGQRDFMEKYPGIGGLYPDGDATALASLLKSFIDDPEKLDRSRKQAWDYARTELNWENEQQELLARIGKIIANL